MFVRLVPADVAAPHYPSAVGAQEGQHGCGLRVVHDDDVSGFDDARDVLEVAAVHGLERRPVLIAEAFSIPGLTVQQVVQPLGHREELRLAVQDQPPAVDAGRSDVPEEDWQHFRDPATDSGGVDVPHAVAAQRVAGCLSVMRELVETVEADDIHQPLRGDVRYLDGLHGEDCRFNGGSESPT